MIATISIVLSFWLILFLLVLGSYYIVDHIVKPKRQRTADMLGVLSGALSFWGAFIIMFYLYPYYISILG
jgi:hypothetical protein